jgi:hypothetical protein
MVHICDECNYGSNENRCVVCGNVGVTDAYYCRECVQQEKNRDGCPKVVNLGAVSCIAVPPEAAHVRCAKPIDCSFLCSSERQWLIITPLCPFSLLDHH